MPLYQTSEDSLSPVPKLILNNSAHFTGVLADLQNVRTFAPLQAQFVHEIDNMFVKI